MFYDDYATLFNPRSKKAAAAPLDAQSALNRLWAAARGQGYDLDEWAVSRNDKQRVRDVIAAAMVTPVQAPAPRTGRVAADKRDTVGAKALSPRTVRGFLADAVGDRKGGRIVAQRVGDEAWIGATYSGQKDGVCVVAVRLPAALAPWVTTELRASDKSGMSGLQSLTRTETFADLAGYVTESPSAAQEQAWDDLRAAWQRSSTWTRANVSRAAAKAAYFAPKAGANKYGLDVVLWDATASRTHMNVPSRLVTPLANYPGSFVVTDGNRLAIIGVDAAPGALSVQIPRAMFDYSDPREVWGSDNEKAVAMGAFLSHGRITEFPAYYEVLPRNFGVAMRLTTATLEEIRVPSRASLGSLPPNKMISHAGLFLLGDGHDRMRVAVHFIPKGANVYDNKAFPPRIVGTFPAEAISPREDRVKQGFAPMHLQAAFMDDTVESLLASGDRDVYLLTGGNEHDALGPVGVVSASQIHLLMPMRIEKGYVESVFAKAEAGGLTALSDVEYAGDFSEYPVGTVALDATGASYKALLSAAWGSTSPRYRSMLRVLPVEGPNGPETWVALVASATVVRLPGALVDKSYVANDVSKVDALLAQIIRNPTLPPALSPSDMLDLDKREATEAAEALRDNALAFSDRVMQMDANIASTLTTTLGEDTRGLDEAFVTADGTAFSTDGSRAFIAPDAVPRMQYAKLSAVSLPPQALYEIEKGVEEFVVGDRWIATGRVLVRRRDTQAPAVLDVVERALAGTVKAEYRVTDIPAFLRAMQAARKVPEAKEAGDKHTFVVFGSNGTVSFRYNNKAGASVPSSIVEHDSGGVRVALRVVYLMDALRAVQNTGGSEAHIALYGELNPAIVQHARSGRQKPYSLVMPVRLD